MIGPSFPAVLAAAQGGDEQAFAVLWRELQPAVLRYLRVAAPVAAEDLAADTWMSVIRGLARFRGDEQNFRTWVFTVARHRATDRRRQAVRRPSGSLPVEVLAAWPAPDDPVAEVLVAQSTRAALALIAELPANQAEVVALRVLGGLGVAEVARIVGKRPSAVRLLAHRGLRRLAKRLEAAGLARDVTVSDQDGLVADMHRLLGSLAATPPTADQDTLERLLAGPLNPAEAPAGYAALARLLAAATAPATSKELDGEQLVLAEFKAVVQSPPLTLVRRRANMLSKLASVKAAAAVLAAVLSIGGVAAAATGLLPGRAEQAADQVPSTTGAGAAGHGLWEAAVVDLGAAAKTGLCQAWQAGKGADHGGRAESPAFRALAVAAGGADNVAAYCKDAAAGGSAERQDRAAAAGPDALAAARAGLCQAWQAGEGADHGRRADSVAFQALAAAAGGADQVADFCRGTAAGSAGSQGEAPSSTPPTTVSPPSSGPPASTGQGGRSRGGPPTTS